MERVVDEMNTERYLNMVGRSKDMVIRGGENVYAREIEEFLYTHQDITDAQVIGCPIVDERSMTVTGKVRKTVMREHAIEQLGLRTTA